MRKTSIQVGLIAALLAWPTLVFAGLNASKSFKVSVTLPASIEVADESKQLNQQENLKKDIEIIQEEITHNGQSVTRTTIVQK